MCVKLRASILDAFEVFGAFFDSARHQIEKDADAGVEARQERTEQKDGVSLTAKETRKEGHVSR